MNIFFKGYYGFKNIGDDVFVHTIDWFCKKNDFKNLAMNTDVSVQDVIEKCKNRVNPLEYRKVLLEKMDRIAKVINNENF